MANRIRGNAPRQIHKDKVVKRRMPPPTGMGLPPHHTIRNSPSFLGNNPRIRLGGPIY